MPQRCSVLHGIGIGDQDGCQARVFCNPMRPKWAQDRRSPRFHMNDGVLRPKMGLPFVFMVFFHCLWVWKGRTYVSERVYRLGRGPWRHNIQTRLIWSEPGCQSRSPRFQTNDKVLRPEMRWPFVFMVFFHAYGYGKFKGRTDVSERGVYRLGRGPWRHKGV